jgi:hypothetical protein
VDRDSSGNLDELAHLRRTGLPILGTQAIVIQRDSESTSGVATPPGVSSGRCVLATVRSNLLLLPYRNNLSCSGIDEVLLRLGECLPLLLIATAERETGRALGKIGTSEVSLLQFFARTITAGRYLRIIPGSSAIGLDLREQRDGDKGMQNDAGPQQKTVHSGDYAYPSKQQSYAYIKRKKSQNRSAVQFRFLRWQTSDA